MTIGVCWEFFEFGADKFFYTDMQKDSIITNISTVELDETNSNKSVILNNIYKTILYDEHGNEIAVFSNGYLDVGLNDTIDDLFVNLIGALVFSVLGYFYTLNKKKYTFIKNFIPIKTVNNKNLNSRKIYKKIIKKPRQKFWRFFFNY